MTEPRLIFYASVGYAEHEFVVVVYAKQTTLLKVTNDPSFSVY